MNSRIRRSGGSYQTTPRSRGRSPLGIYLHLPFCTSRCSYCNFYSTTDPAFVGDYIQALCRAIETAPLDRREATTIYFGGGTPSLLGVSLLTLLDAVRKRLPVREDAEITLEANPGTLMPGMLEALRAGGFNRISFGWQAATDSQLKLLGRNHTAAQGRQAVELARAAGFENISVDIMLGTPGQTLDDALALCREAIAMEVPHISSYMLKVEPDTPFAKAGLEARCPDDDETADLYLAVCDCLTAAGYDHYEISNFAKTGYESRHNNAYWLLRDYLGIGPSAHSLLDGRRFHFPSDLMSFLMAEDVWSTTQPDGDGGGWDEYLMLALRLHRGLPLTEFSTRYGIDPGRLSARARPLIAQGLLTQLGDYIALTDRGFLVSNSVINFLSDGVFLEDSGEC